MFTKVAYLNFTYQKYLPRAGLYFHNDTIKMQATIAEITQK